MTKTDTTPDIDWTQCELIECVPGKVSGRPVVRGTRIMPEAIVGSYELGETIDELHATAYMGWAGLKNGELLRKAEDSGIEVLLTGDQTLNHEQNLSGRRLAIVALSAIQLPIIRANLPAIVAAIGNAAPGSFQVVECGTFRRKRPRGD